MSPSGSPVDSLEQERNQQHTNRPHSRHALPVPILRGARIIDLASYLPPNSSSRCHSKSSLLLHNLPVPNQTSETLPLRFNAPPRAKSPFEQQPEPNPECEQRPTAPSAGSEVRAQTWGEEVALGGFRERTESKSYPTSWNLTTATPPHNALPQTPVVVSRAILEDCDPFRRHSESGLERSVEPPPGIGPNGRAVLKDGGHASRLRLMAAHSDSSARHLCFSGSVDGAQCLQSALADQTGHSHRTDTAITRPASSTTATADAVEQLDLHHQATRSNGYHNNADIMSSGSNMEPSPSLEDMSRKRLGCPSTPQVPAHQPSLRLTPQPAPGRIFGLPSYERETLMLKPSPSLNQTQHPNPRLSTRSEEQAMTSSGMSTPLLMHQLHYKHARQAGSETSLVIPLGEDDEPGSVPTSPCSDAGTEEGEYETPLTSPSRSPIKTRRGSFRVSRTVHHYLAQLDGQGEASADEGGSANDSDRDSATAEEDGSYQEDSIGHERESGVSRDAGLKTSLPKRRATTRGQQHPIEPSTAEVQDYPRIQVDDTKLGDIPPLAPATPARGAFPFPCLPGLEKPKRASPRYPSALLRHCERNVTPRQKRLMAGGLQSPDRFIPNRAGTPTKQSYLLTKNSPRPSGLKKMNADIDPFDPVPSRSLRMAGQYATLRSPPPVPRPVGMVGTRVLDAQPSTHRAASAGTVWTVGGSMVTEGVMSTTNGRGGRVTSGSTAPHYVADFLWRDSPSEDEVTHGRRLALAMDIDQSARMIDHSSPSSVNSSSPENARNGRARKWRDGAWQQDGVLTPTKSKTKKSKDVPIIPFRVLDAPSLRDDYYCSLLSYSPTLQCLAVGLGPHVYLWSENRGSTNILDSLTAPLGSAHVTSLSFSSIEGESAILAIGRADGRITLWSPRDRDPRFDSDQPSPVSCVCFRPTTSRRPSIRDPAATVATEELLVGDEVGYVYYYSIEWPNQQQRDLFDWHGSMTLLARINCHSQQVCGIAWSPDGGFFATGGNDNQLFLFESKKILQPSRYQRESGSVVHVRSESSSSNATITGQNEVLAIVPGQERHVFALNAAVKAIAFAPWQSTLLAAGGGSNDRCIHFFHTLSGASLGTIECHAQVTSLVFSEKRQEIATTFGFAQPEHPYRVAVFTWPSCDMVVKIPWWGEERALFAVAYPRGPSSGQRPDSSTYARQNGSRADAEGRPWYGKRTREEGCLVVATSDASIKFHEIWAEHSTGGGKRVASGVLGGSPILEEECSGDIGRWNVIR